ncbi:MAG: hypothetical protein ACO3IO_01975 [Candidatus Nanopelagicus sp.]|jgi:hypothetical protein
MNNYLDQVREVFFINNGETDLLTGSSAPNLFNQLVKRDIQLRKRNTNGWTFWLVDEKTRKSMADLREEYRELIGLEDGRTLTQTLDFIATATGSSQVRRLTNSIQIAIHRGTPILEVLNNQVLALNKQINFNLMKLSGKSEITLLIPVVFLILPVSISFAIWPSIYGLNQAGF